jgi:hypothetical protein
MHAFETVPTLDRVKRGVHQIELEQRLARHMVAGSPINADAR